MANKQNIKSKFKYLLPVEIKKTLKYILYSIQDLLTLMSGKKKSDYPPKRLNFVGSGDFIKVGNEFTEHFKEIGGLKPDNTVLDIGSGIGRMAIPLTKYLKGGEYYGFDIDKRGIQWCKKNISKKHSNFHFEYVDIYNKFYNKKGKIKASQFKFPYSDKKFDFIFATSVFTHMLPDQVTQYLAEIKRVLKENGKCFLTFFSIDEEAKSNILNEISYCKFIYPFNEENTCFYTHKNNPEAEIAFKENWIIQQLEKATLSKDLGIFHGKWSGRKVYTSYQDIFISKKV